MFSFRKSGLGLLCVLGLSLAPVSAVSALAAPSFRVPEWHHRSRLERIETQRAHHDARLQHRAARVNNRRLRAETARAERLEHEHALGAATRRHAE